MERILYYIINYLYRLYRQGYSIEEIKKLLEENEELENSEIDCILRLLEEVIKIKEEKRQMPN